MVKLISEKIIREIFDVSVILKGVHAAAELLGGAAMLFMSPSLVMSWAKAMTADELAGDPHDFLANYLMRQAGMFSTSFQHMAALYLISHGLVIGFLVWGLLAKKLWSYPAAMAVLAAFIAYQTYQYALRPSWWIAAVTVLDIVVIFLTMHEYRYIRKEKAGAAAAS